MGNVIIQEETPKKPISLIGKEAGICWGSDTADEVKNYKRGLDCIESNHGRTLEFPQVYLVLDGFSARVIREWYTHIGGAPTRLQASTRYIDYKNFNYITPDSVKNNKDALKLYQDTMDTIAKAKEELETKFNISKEDAALLLPLGMTTKVVTRTNLRNLIDMSRQRMCNRANWEYRQLFNQLCEALSNYSEEWYTVVHTSFHAKCEGAHYCLEKHSCGKYPRKVNNEASKPKFVVGSTYTGIVNSTNYSFRCIYTNGNTYYFLCLTNLGNTNWSTACSYTWTVTIQGKTVTAKIPTIAQLNIATRANIATGFNYWTSTPNRSSFAWYVYSDGGLSCDDGSNGAVPLAVISL